LEVPTKTSTLLESVPKLDPVTVKETDATVSKKGGANPDMMGELYVNIDAAVTD
jgi:hypothetical protein